MTWSSYFQYIFYHSRNPFVFPVMLISFIATEAIYTIFFRFLAYYDEIVSGEYELFPSINSFWTTMGLLMLGYFLLQVLKCLFLGIILAGNAEAIHADMVFNLLRAQMSFFDLTPSGKTLAKFSNDLNFLDQNMIFTLYDVLENCTITVVIMANVIQINNYFLIPTLICLVLFIAFYRWSNRVMMESKTLDMKTKSPVIGFAVECLNGALQIKCFNQKNKFLKAFCRRLNDLSKANILHWITIRAFTTFISLVAILVLISGLLLGLITVTPEESGLYGVSIVFLSQAVNLFQLFLKGLVNFKTSMIIFERCRNIRDVPCEKKLRDTETTQREESEDRKGRELQVFDQTNNKINLDETSKPKKIRFRNLSLKYSEDSKAVLDNLKLNIEPEEKLAIVGRTGAGKSSILQVLFRLNEPEPGTEYTIGDQDALELGLHDLRLQISVIPQTPFFFSGSIRDNLDPFSQKTDQEIWEALASSHLEEAVRKVLFCSCSWKTSSTAKSMNSLRPFPPVSSNCSLSPESCCSTTKFLCLTKRLQTWT